MRPRTPALVPSLDSSVISLVLGLVTLHLASMAQAHPDDIFWSPDFGRPGTGGRTHTVEVLEIHQGELYLGGGFDSATDERAGGIARWDGAIWHALASSGNGTVYEIYFDGADIYAGGSFTEIDGVAANGIARWDGLTWSPLGAGVAGAVRAILRHDGDLYVGGLFSTAGGVSSPSIARWDGATWSAVGSGIPPVFLFDGVYALASDGTDLVVGGQFETVDALSVGNVARWDGSAWATLGDGLTLSGQSGVVNDLVVYDGFVHAGGAFTDSGPTPLDHVARWDGAAWVDVGGGLAFASNPASTWVTDLKVLNSTLYAAGRFTQAGGSVPADRVAWWDGMTWSGYNGPSIEFVDVGQVGLQDGDLHVSGAFRTIDGVVASHVARWDGSAWDPLSTVVTLGVENDVLALASDVAGNVYVGGMFDAVGHSMARSLARWDGASWQDVGGGVNTVFPQQGAVHAVEVAGSDVLVGGSFVDAGGVSAENVARWDGVGWHALGAGMTGAGAATGVLALETQDGEVYAGGRFPTAGGASASNVAVWDGAAWSPLGAGTDDAVFALASYAGEIYAGGEFTSAGGAPASRVARWDGSAWFPVGDGFDAGVRALAVLDGALVAGGQFTLSGATAVNGIARWNGSSWEALDQGLQGGFVEVRSLVPVGSFLYVGGQFETAGSLALAVNNVALWNGQSWLELGSGTSESVTSLALAGGSLYVGGFHTLAGDKPSSHLSRWIAAATSVGEAPRYPSDVLAQNVPNPFNPRTQIHYEVAVSGPVTLRIYDVAGRLVRTLVDAVQAPRAEGYTVTWDGTADDGRPVASGTYVYTLAAPGQGASRKMLLVR